MAKASVPTSTHLRKVHRIPPSAGAGLLVVLGYSAIFTVTAATSGIPYTEWFASAPNVWRTAVLPLVFGTVFLIAFLAWARWDGVFRDRERLSVPVILKLATALFAAGIAVHLVFVNWGGLDAAIVLPILITGVLVGFCEETLFRGILLRGIRAEGRSEATVAVGTSIAFGLFHLTNIITGSPLPAVLSQVLLATCSGIILYSFRRITGALIVAMIAHGMWDASLFLPAAPPTTASTFIGLILLVVVPAFGVIALVVVGRRERHTPAIA